MPLAPRDPASRAALYRAFAGEVARLRGQLARATTAAQYAEVEQAAGLLALRCPFLDVAGLAHRLIDLAAAGQAAAGQVAQR